MKKIILALLPIFAIVSCGDPALDADYGDTLIYMPQAAHNIGVDNNLTLSISAAAVAEDPERMTETTIGVYRSGTADKKAFSVDLVVAKDTLAMRNIPFTRQECFWMKNIMNPSRLRYPYRTVSVRQ